VSDVATPSWAEAIDWSSPDWFDQLAAVKDDDERFVSTSPTGPSKWGLLYEPIPESGGPFGGRNQALAVLCGMYRSKRIPFDVALPVIQQWNRDYCQPPLPEREVHNLVGRAWVQWAEGKGSDMTPAEARGEKPPLRFMTVQELLDIEKNGGGAKFLVDKAVVENGLNMVTSPPGGAKSWFMLDLARRFVTGEPWFGDRAVTQCPVLYLDEEMGENSVSTRVRKLCVPTDAPFYYLGRAGVKITTSSTVREILAFCEQNEIRVVFFDTLIRFHDLNENDNSEMSRLQTFFQPFLEAGITAFLGHHDRKRGGDETVKLERSRGAGDIQGQMDMTYGIDKIGGGAYKLTVTKPRHISEEEAALLETCFVIEDFDNGEHTRLREITLAQREEEKREETKRKVLQVLLEGPKNVTEIRSLAGGRCKNVGEVVKQLEKDGIIVAGTWAGKKRYRIAGSEPDEDDYEYED
jgi:hypothetical protein